MADFLTTLFKLATGKKDKLEVEEIPVEDVMTSPHQPREQFDEKALQELSESIQKLGVIQPIVVRKKGLKYELVAGERRLRAAKIADLQKIPAVVRDLTEEQALAMALVENLQREDLNPIEEGKVYLKLVQDLKLTQKEIAQQLGKSPQYISNHIKLLRLPEPVQEDVAQGRIPKAAALQLLRLKNPKNQLHVASVIKEKGLPLERAEEMIRKALIQKRRRVSSSSEDYEEWSSEEVYSRIKTLLSVYRGSRKGMRVRKTIRKSFIEIKILIPRY